LCKDEKTVEWYKFQLDTQRENIQLDIQLEKMKLLKIVHYYEGLNEIFDNTSKCAVTLILMAPTLQKWF